MVTRLLLAATFVSVLASPASAKHADPAATLVYGQPDFAANAVGHDAAGLSFPICLAQDADGGLDVADRNNSRILYFAADGDTTADWVFGQFGSFTTSVANNDGSGTPGDPTAQNLNHPQFVMIAADGSLYISDTGNNRVLVLPSDVLP